MSKEIKPPVLVAVAIAVAGVLGLVGYKVLMPPTTQKTAASVESANYSQQQEDRFKFTAAQKANMDQLPPYLKKAAESSSNQRNAARIPELLRLQQTDPGKLTANEKDFIGHLPPYLKRVNGGGAPPGISVVASHPESPKK